MENQYVAAKDYRPIASDGALGLLNLGFGESIKQYDYEDLRQQFLAYYENNIARILAFTRVLPSC